MKARIVVIGGTSGIGSKVVETLEGHGNKAVVASSNTGVFPTPAGEAITALTGADIVVDVANAPSFDDQAAWDFFQIVGENLAAGEVADAIGFFRAAHENLVAAELTAGVKHHVALSAVGLERLQDGAYFRAKLIQENIIKGSPIPYTIVRCTQLFDWIRQLAKAGTDGNTVRASHSPIQPVATDDVASVVADVALQAPRNGTVEIAGPDVFFIDELLAKVLEHDNDPRNVVRDDVAGLFFGIQVDEQTLMPGIDVRIGSTRLEWWLNHAPQPQ